MQEETLWAIWIFSGRSESCWCIHACKMDDAHELELHLVASDEGTMTSMEMFKRSIVGVALSLISSSVFACKSETMLREAASSSLFSDPDIVRYVCGDAEGCGVRDFVRKLEVHQVVLAPDGAAIGLRIEPLAKSRQYFSAFFLRDKCQYKMVFAPDVTLSGVEIIKRQQHHFYILRATERDSGEVWKEYDFAYVPSHGRYEPVATHCKRMDGDRIVGTPCM